MKLLSEIAAAFLRLIDIAAQAVSAVAGRFEPKRQTELIENEDKSFTLRVPTAPNGAELREHRFSLDGGPELPAEWRTALRGSQLEIVLRPIRFLYRPLELPKRASEFLDGIVRAQIDRLTPWTLSEAVFHWLPPTDIANDRIRLVVVATAKAGLSRLLEVAADFGVTAIAISTVPQDAPIEAARIRVFEQQARAAAELSRIRRILTIVFLVTGLTAAISTVTSSIMTGNLNAEEQRLAKQISDRRIALRAGLGAENRSPQRMLETRKQATPSSVIVLETLSQILPDNTYVTEMRIEGDKLQIVGITQDAPSLVQLIEQSPQFMRATFFAPTTRSANDPGERFHIETRIKPYFPPNT